MYNYANNRGGKEQGAGSKRIEKSVESRGDKGAEEVISCPMPHAPKSWCGGCGRCYPIFVKTYISRYVLANQGSAARRRKKQ